MAADILKEPHKSYMLELMKGFGEAAGEFILAGAQSMRFSVPEARLTRDFDFVLDIVALREVSTPLVEVLKVLGYEAVEGARRFQFTKKIPDTNEEMRIEFLGSDRERRPNDFRVDVQPHIKPHLHARACTGSEIVLHESMIERISGQLPDGQNFTFPLRVVRPHALVMMKLFAMDDRYQNIRGQSEAEHDRNEAKIHAADIVNLVMENIRKQEFHTRFRLQFEGETELQKRAFRIIESYYEDLNAPGLVLYAEFLREQGYTDDLDLELVPSRRTVRLLLQDSLPL